MMNVNVSPPPTFGGLATSVVRVFVMTGVLIACELKSITRDTYNGAMSFRTASEFIQRTYMLRPQMLALGHAKLQFGQCHP